MSALSLLETGRALLIEDGWCQDINVNAFGQRCSSGALCEARNLAGATFAEMLEAENALTAAMGGVDFVSWNDTSDRTVDEVLAAWDIAIATATMSP